MSSFMLMSSFIYQQGKLYFLLKTLCIWRLIVPIIKVWPHKKQTRRPVTHGVQGREQPLGLCGRYSGRGSRGDVTSVMHMTSALSPYIAHLLTWKITLYLTGTAASEDSKLGSGCGGSLLCCAVLNCNRLNDCTLEIPACTMFLLSLSKLIFFQLLVTLPS